MATLINAIKYAHRTPTAWWLTNSSEQYMSSSVGISIPSRIGKEIKQSKPPTSQSTWPFFLLKASAAKSTQGHEQPVSYATIPATNMAVILHHPKYSG